MIFVSFQVSKKRSNFRPDRARGRGGPRGGMGMQGLPDPYQAIASMMGLMTGASVPSPYRGRGRGGRGGPSRGF